MDVPILFCDRLFLNRMKELKQKGKTAVVHSIFQKAMNLEAEGQLYTILALEKGPLLLEEQDYLGIPKSAYADIENFMTIKSVPGTEVFGMEKGIQMGETVFVFPDHMVLFSDAFFKPEDLPRADQEKIKRGLKRFDRLILTAAEAKGAGAGPFYARYFGMEHSEPEFLQKELEKRLTVLCTWMKEKENYKELQQAAEGIVGAGIGLTPSADDFLCGVLLSMNCLEGHMDKRVRQAVETGILKALSRKRTTDVSEEMLSLHVQKLYPRLNKKLAESFLMGGTGMEQVMERLQKVGHSSGVDMACGMAAAFRLWMIQENVD